MRTTIPPGVSSACAVFASGAAAGLALRAARESWAGAPLVLAWCLLAPALVVFFLPRFRHRVAWSLSAVGTMVLVGWPWWGRGLARLVGVPDAALAVAVCVPLAAGAAILPVAHAARRAASWTWCAAPLALVAGATLEVPVGVAGCLLLVGVGTRVDPPLDADAARGAAPGWRTAAGALAVVTAALALFVSWSLLRASLGPAPAEALPALVALGLAALAPGGFRSAGVGVIAAATALFLANSAAPNLPLVLALGGLGLGLVVRGVARARTSLLAAGLSLWGVRVVFDALPDSVLTRAATTQVGLFGDADYRAALLRSREEGNLALAEVGPRGAVQVWRAGRRVVAELDGTLAGASSRARSAETMAGVLAGCASTQRGRAILVGDELGLAAGSIREQGFSGVDVAVGSGSVVSAVAELDEAARRTWLAAETRLVRAPGPALVHLGDPASAVVIVQRAAWTDGTSILPGPVLLSAAMRRAPAGAVVVVLPALGVAPSVLTSAIAAFSNVFPNASLWLPPQGGEHAILVGTQERLSWPGVERCFEASREWLSSQGVADAVDLAGLAVAGGDWMRTVSDALPPVWARVPPTSTTRAITLGQLGLDTAGAVEAFGKSAPTEQIAARRAARRAALAVLEASAAGSMTDAISRARALADTPGAQAALEPLVSPLLDRARAAAGAAQREGPESSRWTDAEGAVMAALLVHPGSAEAQCTRGEIAFARRQLDVALEAFATCVERGPERVAGWEGLARVRRVAGDLDGAEAALRKALALAPSRLQPALHLGILLTDRDQPDEAERWLRRAADLADSASAADRARTHLALGRLYVKTGRSRPALAEARRAEIESPSADAAYWTGAAQYQLGAKAEAEASFRVALGRDGNHTGALNDLGMCLADRGAYVEAVDAFRRVLTLDPESTGATNNLERLRPFVAGDGAP